MRVVTEPRIRTVLPGGCVAGLTSPTPNGNGPADDDTAAAFGIVPVDWSTFWSDESPAEDYVLDPLVLRGRQTGIYSTAKAGKSLLAIDLVAAGATGRPILGQPAREPVTVVYVDLEMTQADLRERLTDLGYGPDDDLGQLHYYQLPALPPLDTALGGEVLLGIAQEHAAALVVIDTMARAVAGEENAADTYRGFYTHTGRPLKAAGIALLRLDHSGKDPAAGQRGSSAKVDDVDVVFKLTQVDSRRLVLARTHSRVPWVPAEVAIDRLEEPLRHVLAGDTWPAGTHDVALALDDLDVPLDAATSTALAALKSAAKGKRKALVIAALKHRRTRP